VFHFVSWGGEGFSAAANTTKSESTVKAASVTDEELKWAKDPPRMDSVIVGDKKKMGNQVDRFGEIREIKLDEFRD
jgi:hypothetical protein